MKVSFKRKVILHFPTFMIISLIALVFSYYSHYILNRKLQIIEKKETLFNMMGPYIVFTTFLDLFAGTGNIGIEALSRGAKQVVFVEKIRSHVRVLKRNLATCALESQSRVYCGDANRIMSVLQKENWQFDIVFLDPPFQSNVLAEVCRLLDTGGWLKPGARIYIELPRNAVDQAGIPWKQLKSKTAGQVSYALYQADS